MKKDWLSIKQNQNQDGFSIVEVLLSGSIFILLVTALVGGYLFGEEASVTSGNRFTAITLAEEGLEAARNIRDEDFANLTDGTHGLAISGDEWNFSGSSDTNGIFTRSVTIASIDSHRKSVTANVNWQQNEQRDGSVSFTTYLTEWMREVILSSGDWSNPAFATSTDLSSTQNGYKLQVLGEYVYLVRQGGTEDLAVIDVSNPNSPDVESTLDVSNNSSDIYLSGNYAYIANTSNASELDIVNISNPNSPSIADNYNSSGNDNGLGIQVVGTTAYLTRNSGASTEFEIINVTNPSSPSPIGSLNLSGQTNDVVVSGNYAYVASGSLSEELQVINISNPASPVQVASLNLAGSANGVSIVLVGSTILLAQSTSLYVIDVSTPTSPSLLGSYNAGDTVNDIAITLANSNTYAFIATNSDTAEFQVVDISNPSSPVLAGSVDTTGSDNLTGVAYDEDLDRAFGASARNTAEFMVFMPQ